MSGLFNEPFNLDSIERCLSADWEQFGSIAHLAIGHTEAWERAVDQVARLFDAFAAAGRDDGPLYRLFDMLWRRAGQLRDPQRARQLMQAAFGFMPPVRMQVRPSDQATEKAEQDRRWLDAYKASRSPHGQSGR